MYIIPIIAEVSGMVIGIEWFVIQNLGMNALILTLAARMASVRAERLRVLCAALLGCFYAVCAYLPHGGWLLGILPRTAVCALMVLILCGRRSGEWSRTLRIFAFVWVATLLLGGTGAGLMYMLGASGYSPLAALITALLGGTVLLFLTAERNRTRSSSVVQLTIVCGNRAVRFPAAVDTGNVLVEPLSNLPVIVVEKRMLRGIARGRPYRRVPFASVGGEGVLPAFLPDRIRINGKECDACIAVYDGQLCMEGYGLIPGRCLEDEYRHNAMGKGAAPTVGRGAALHRGQSDAARTVHTAGGGAGHGSAASGR